MEASLHQTLSMSDLQANMAPKVVFKARSAADQAVAKSETIINVRLAC